MFTVEPHPLLDTRAFIARWSEPLGAMSTPPAIVEYMSVSGESPKVPVRSDDRVRKTVRDLLRHGGFKPSGRSKPSSEYLLRAAGDGRLNSINLAVDVGNVVSLHSGLPISVVDLGKLHLALRRPDITGLHRKSPTLINFGTDSSTTQ